MNVIKIIFVFLLSLLCLFPVVSLFIPSYYKVEHKITIKKEPKVVFDYINDFRKYKNCFFTTKNDTTKYSLGRIKKGTGATITWSNEKNEKLFIRIIKTVPYKRIECYIDSSNNRNAIEYWNFTKSENGTIVTLGLAGDCGWNLIKRYTNLIVPYLENPKQKFKLEKLKLTIKDGRF